MKKSLVLSALILLTFCKFSTHTIELLNNETVRDIGVPAVCAAAATGCIYFSEQGPLTSTRHALTICSLGALAGGAVLANHDNPLLTGVMIGALALYGFLRPLHRKILVEREIDAILSNQQLETDLQRAAHRDGPTNDMKKIHDSFVCIDEIKKMEAHTRRLKAEVKRLEKFFGKQDTILLDHRISNLSTIAQRIKEQRKHP